MSTLALIVAPVGDGAPNRPLDVAVVEDLLNRWPDGRPKLPVDGLATPLLLARISLFQTEVVGMSVPDRQVRPGSRTFALLQQMAAPSAVPPPTATPGSDLLRRLDRVAFARALRTAFGIAAPGLDDFLTSLCGDAAITDPRWGVYVLATVKHETADTFRPIEELGRGAGRDYGSPQSYTDRSGRTVQSVYYGRGYIQLTWLANYLRVGQALGLGDSLAARPDLALQPDVAYRVLSRGMYDGLFTGRRLSEFITPTASDYLHARQVVNGMDAADAIAVNAATIEQLLRAAAVA